MKSCLQIVILLGAFLSQAPGQSTGQYLAFHAATLSGASDMVTIQNPPSTSPHRNVTFKNATVYCSVACVATVYQNGANATTTALAIVPLNNSGSGTSLAFSASNAGTGNTLPAYNISAGGILVIDLSSLTLAGTNVSVGIASITGNSQIAIQWVEN